MRGWLPFYRTSWRLGLGRPGPRAARRARRSPAGDPDGPEPLPRVPGRGARARRPPGRTRARPREPQARGRRAGAAWRATSRAWTRSSARSSAWRELAGGPAGRALRAGRRSRPALPRRGLRPRLQHLSDRAHRRRRRRARRSASSRAWCARAVASSLTLPYAEPVPRGLARHADVRQPGGRGRALLLRALVRRGAPASSWSHAVPELRLRGRARRAHGAQLAPPVPARLPLAAAARPALRPARPSSARDRPATWSGSRWSARRDATLDPARLPLLPAERRRRRAAAAPRWRSTCAAWATA